MTFTEVRILQSSIDLYPCLHARCEESFINPELLDLHIKDIHHTSSYTSSGWNISYSECVTTYYYVGRLIRDYPGSYLQKKLSEGYCAFEARNLADSEPGNDSEAYWNKSALEEVSSVSDGFITHMDPYLLDHGTHLLRFQIFPTLNMFRDQDSNFTSEDDVHQSSLEVNLCTYRDTSVMIDVRDDNEPTVSVLNGPLPARYLKYAAFFGRSGCI